jgi:hypothetical protein
MEGTRLAGAGGRGHDAGRVAAGGPVLGELAGTRRGRLWGVLPHAGRASPDYR